jgi:hypothetical protein
MSKAIDFYHRVPDKTRTDSMANCHFLLALRLIFMLDTNEIAVLHTTTSLHKWYDLLPKADGLERSF